MDINRLRQEFQAIFRRPPVEAAAAPGRVNLIGEHTDYNGGFVLPIAIQRRTVALCAPRRDRTLRFASLQADGPPVAVELDKPIVPLDKPRWANYCKGVAAVLIEHGLRLGGADVLLAGDVPLGGGLSSSASLEVATALVLLSAAGQPHAVAGAELARLCQKAENVYAGAPCGIMDQSIAVMGRSGHALLLDCRSGLTQQVPFDDPDVVLLVADTQVKHDIGDGGYPLRRRQCAAAAQSLGITMLREAHPAMLDAAARAGRLTGTEFLRARHVVGEIARTLQAVEALRAGDFVLFGRLMNASHASLRDDFAVSCEELDAVSELAGASSGVYGARMTGGGFGGCAIILCRSDAATVVSETVASGFAQRFGRRCPVFATTAAGGAAEIPLPG